MRKLYSKDREDRAEVVIDWNIGNSCSLSCSYCHPHFRAGTNRFPDLDKAILFIDRVADHHRRRTNRGMRLSITGGEPTNWLALPALCAHAKTAGMFVEVKSNGMAASAVWMALVSSLKMVSLTLHVGADFNIFRENCHLLRDSGVGVSISAAMTPNGFATLLDHCTTLRADGFVINYIPLYHDHARRTRLLDYTPDQLAILFPRHDGGDVVVEHHTGTTSYRGADEVIHRRANSFTGMRCGIGVDQFVIDQDGTVWGGWCRVGGSLGNIHDGDFTPFAEAPTCTKATCDNPLDLSTPKWLSSG